MAETVNLPLIGQTRRGVAVGGIFAIGTVGAYLIYRHLKTKSSTTTASQYGYGSGAYAYGYGSQYGYGTQQYGYGAYTYDGSSGYGYGSGGGGVVGGGGTVSDGGTGLYGYGTQTVPSAATTNTQWAANAVSALAQQGYNTMAVTAALSLYLTGGSLSPDQVSIVQAALALEGDPPQSGAGGYPPQIRQGGGGGGGGQGGGGGRGGNAGPISNLQASNVTKTSFTVNWNPASNATGYKWDVKQMNGVDVKSGSGSSTNAKISGLHPGWTYNFGVQGLPGGPGNNIHITTKS